MYEICKICQKEDREIGCCGLVEPHLCEYYLELNLEKTCKFCRSEYRQCSECRTSVCFCDSETWDNKTVCFDCINKENFEKYEKIIEKETILEVS